MATPDKRSGRFGLRRRSGPVPPAQAPVSSGRYTPPLPRARKVSPRWVPVLMFVCLALGMVVIVTNYPGLLPGRADTRYLLLGLALITVGFVVATRYR